MTAIAKRLFAAVLAAAKEQFAIGFGGVFHWREISAFVSPIAKRLPGGPSAGTPEVGFSCFDLDGHRRFLCDNGGV